MLLECLCARDLPYLVLSEWDHTEFGFHLNVVLSPGCNYWTRGGAASVPCLAPPSPPISIHLLRSNRPRLIFPPLPLWTSPNYTLDQNSFRGIVKRQKIAKNCVSILIPPAPCYLDRSSVQLHAKGQKWANSKSLFDLGKSLEQNEAIQDDGFVFCQLVGNH